MNSYSPNKLFSGYKIFSLQAQNYDKEATIQYLYLNRRFDKQ